MSRTNGKTEFRTSDKGHESDFRENAKGAETLGSGAFQGGQRKPHCCPRHCPYPDVAELPLGTPIAIEDVAELLGCSPWTVRQKYLPQGLPYLRASVAGKFIFFREQVLDWILKRQGKEE
jgi:hypothetical protein